MEVIINSLRRLVAENLDLNGVKPEEINPDVQLMGGGLHLNSISIVKLIVLSEQEFGIEFGEEDLVMESFASLRSLAAVIAVQRNGQDTDSVAASM